MPSEHPIDAILFLSFGGPECREDVIPFLENVLRERNVPKERMLAVAEHYYRYDGISPINRQNRDLIKAIRTELAANGLDLPVYFGNRNWDPLLVDTMQEMVDAGIRNALVFITSVYSSYSGCRQYREDLLASQQAVKGAAPEVQLTRKFYNHPGWIETQIDLITGSLARIPEEQRGEAHIVYVAHSIPIGMADNCNYVRQLNESATLITSRLENDHAWSQAWQSRSGPPRQPWLEPDINDHLRNLSQKGVKDIVVAPIGFISDHLEVMYDLDEEAAATARQTGINMVRCPSAGTHPRFVSMIRELIEERLDDSNKDRPFVGETGPSWDVCPDDCCLPGTGPPAPRKAEHPG